MSIEKIAVLVLTGLIAILLAVAVINGEDRPDPKGKVKGAGSVEVTLPMKEVSAADAKARRDGPAGSVFESLRKGDLETSKVEQRNKPKTDEEKSEGPATTTVAVEHGDTYKTIARRLWGNIALWPLIEKANPGVNPKKLKAGMTLTVPVRNVKGKKAADGDGDAAKGDADAAGRKGPGATAPKQGPSGGGRKEHTVQRGETLQAIAKSCLGRAAAWKSIYDINRDVVSDPRVLRAGIVLKMP